jgi:hypothetical protein
MGIICTLMIRMIDIGILRQSPARKIKALKIHCTVFKLELQLVELCNVSK